MAVAVESVVGAEQYPSPPAAITPWAMMENEKSAHGGCASSQRRTFSGEIPVMAGLMEKISNLASAGKIKLRYQTFFGLDRFSKRMSDITGERGGSGGKEGTGRLFES